jgi:hypothetical protein
LKYVFVSFVTPSVWAAEIPSFPDGKWKNDLLSVVDRDMLKLSKSEAITYNQNFAAE